MKKKFENIVKKYDKKYNILNTIKYIFFLLLLVSFSEIRMRLINSDDTIHFMSLFMLMVLFLLLFIALDLYIERLKLIEIIRENKTNKKRFIKISMYMQRIQRTTMYLSDIAIKYQYCWEFLKNTLAINNPEMVDAMKKIEMLSEENLEKEHNELNK